MLYLYIVSTAKGGLNWKENTMMSKPTNISYFRQECLTHTPPTK